MGFYGNITNTSNTTFSFDRIYPNKLSMDANANNDGIFIGRYVLVEYDQDAAYPIIYTDGNKFYSSPNKEQTTQIKFETSDGFFINEIGQVQDIETDNNGNLIKVNSIEFYQCVGGDSEGYAIFNLFTSVNTDNKYIQNFAIDEKEFGNSTFKGYDSTVWVKSSVTSSDGKLITKYVNIADLNSVVPTFDIAADAPTMEPITPHFDADSTNVYYKLHAQTPYGFRVKKQENELLSDEKTKHYTVQYHKDTGVTTSTPTQVDADIYYNKEAFRAKPERDEDGNIIPVVKKDITTVNEIKLQPSGYSENYNNKYSHKTTGDSDLIGDIQEFSLHLPAIGNMMSDAWDIIHGPNRDDARTDENGSLQGRLDSFKFMADNQIPVKRTYDGTLVGTNINGNTPRTVSNIKTEKLHITDKSQDDAWIKTEINTNNLLDEDGNEVGNNGISIHHTFHPDNTNYDFNTNKNTDKVLSNSDYDKIKLYTPSIDAAGHVVGGGYETVTLPYGYKTITTNGRGEDIEINTFDKVAAKIQNIVAENTQDELAINSGNEWIRIDTDAINDILTISHDIHYIEESDIELTDLNELQANQITVQDTIYDAAGHVTHNQHHTYTLPYGFKTINIQNSDDDKSAAPAQTGVKGETADNTQDSLTFEATNKWIKMAAVGEDKENKITFGHELTEINSNSDTDFGLSSDMSVAQVDANNNQFNIPVFQFDKAGHITKAETHTISLPDNFASHVVEISDATDKDSTAGETGTITPDTLTDTLKFIEGNRWINLEANTANDTITFSHYAKDFPESTDTIDFDSSINTINSFDIQNITWDRAGHITASNKVNYILPKSIKTLSIQDTGKDNVSVVTGSTGQLIADNLVDIMTIDNGNRWIRLVANGKTVKLYHDAPNSASGSTNTTNANNNNNKTLSFNSTFEVPQVKYDETGHIFGIDKHTITLPSTSTLRLNNYSKGTSTAVITTNETINNAFGKLENRLDVLQGDKDVVGSVDNKISIEVAKILDDADPSDIDTLKEIAGWIINDSTGAAKMANDISDLKTKMGNSSVATQIANKINALDKPDTVVEGQYVSAVSEANGIITVTRESLPTLSTGSINGTIKLGNDNEVAVKGLGSAAFTESTAYAKSDVLDTKFKYGATEEQKTIADLMNKVAELEIKLNELNNQINPPQEPDEGGETI